MANEQVTLLLHLDLILSGCILVPATKRNRAADVYVCYTRFSSQPIVVVAKSNHWECDSSAAIGMLMFQVAMMPRSPKREVDIRYVEGTIEDQMDHLSPACRDLLLDCLSKFLLAIVLGFHAV